MNERAVRRLLLNLLSESRILDARNREGQITRRQVESLERAAKMLAVRMRKEQCARINTVKSTWQNECHIEVNA